MNMFTSESMGQCASVSQLESLYFKLDVNISFSRDFFLPMNVFEMLPSAAWLRFLVYLMLSHKTELLLGDKPDHGSEMVFVPQPPTQLFCQCLGLSGQEE